MIVKTSILNAKGEKLDVLKWQNPNSNKVLVFVHGLGSNKHENFELFDHIAEHFKKEYSIVQFDFSGYGKSGGGQGDCSLSKMAQDLERVLSYSRSIGGDIYLFAHSMGCFVASYLCPAGIRKAVFSNPADLNMDLLLENLKNRIIVKGGTVNELGVSRYPRTNGEIQLIGKNFWKEFRIFYPKGSLERFSILTPTYIIRANEDEIVQNLLSDFDSVGGALTGMSGDHNFTKPEDRIRLIRATNVFFKY